MTGRDAHSPMGMSALREVHDNVGAAGRGMMVAWRQPERTATVHTDNLDHDGHGFKSPADAL